MSSLVVYRIWYRPRGYKYEITRGYSHSRIIPGFENHTGLIRDAHGRPMVRLSAGRLTVYPGYCYDGPSGPTADDETNMRAALVHDALYQLTREVIQPTTEEAWDFLQKAADKEFRRVLKEDGMPWFRRWYYYRAVRWFGGPHIKGDASDNKERSAPRLRAS